ncbi:epidermis-specific secreted glycoprotein EP1-like [Telopea speciosissima]|uniref:epidermis-specific secreted glycoprotein EP1-like n=1 Tax=Telopea speciosissima TaxID=54955 RepID=UPI001CC796BC|nr:epidermis-specific secreted glycoprotein EP1-like [Telopea speciosissima]
MSSSSSSRLALGLLAVFFLIISLFTAQATVPASKTFKFINQGEIGQYIVEYGADYRVTDLQTFPFALCFYNTTPNAFTLGLRMGNRHSESIMRWVWDANRGNPVHENATLTFGTDGNLVLADVDGSVAWQTGTANKGVVGLRLFSNGNLVLYDQKGRFVWESFDHPTDTLLVGQSLRPGGPNKLISRLSAVDGSEGTFRFELEKIRWAMYMKSKNSVKPLLYYPHPKFTYEKGATLTRLRFNSEPDTKENNAFDLMLELEINNVSSGSSFLARPKYNGTLSMLRLGYDGNLNIYTYYDKVDWGAWETTFSLFERKGRERGRESECQLPTRCGSLGVCEDDQCVACPTQKGMVGWSKSCATPVLPSCNKGKGGAKVDYYKVVGVEHFMNGYTEGDGPMKVVECRDKCSKDCGCLGFFYREESSKCLLAPELGTLEKVSNTTHVAFIKFSK